MCNVFIICFYCFFITLRGLPTTPAMLSAFSALTIVSIIMMVMMRPLVICGNDVGNFSAPPPPPFSYSCKLSKVLKCAAESVEKTITFNKFLLLVH